MVGTGQLGLEEAELLPATQIQLRRPFGVAFDPDGNLYVMGFAQRAHRQGDAMTRTTETLLALTCVALVGCSDDEPPPCDQSVVGQLCIIAGNGENGLRPQRRIGGAPGARGQAGRCRRTPSPTPTAASTSSTGTTTASAASPTASSRGWRAAASSGATSTIRPTATSTTRPTSSSTPAARTSSSGAWHNSKIPHAVAEHRRDRRHLRRRQACLFRRRWSRDQLVPRPAREPGARRGGQPDHHGPGQPGAAPGRSRWRHPPARGALRHRRACALGPRALRTGRGAGAVPRRAEWSERQVDLWRSGGVVRQSLHARVRRRRGPGLGAADVAALRAIGPHPPAVSPSIPTATSTSPTPRTTSSA